MNHLYLPDEILREILAWLPVESLMRSKSVCKHWFSLITSPMFVDLFHSRSSHGLFLIPLPTYHTVLDGGLLILDPNNGRVTIHTPPLSHRYLHHAVSNTVNGLVCFYHIDGNHERSISMYNPTTRENLPLPRLPTMSSARRKCYLGFDVTNKKYKLLHVFAVAGMVECRVLTVGAKDNNHNNTWRNIDTSNIHNKSSILNLSYDLQGFYNNGVIYWTDEDINLQSATIGIFSFNVELEMLEFTHYPKEILSREGEITVCQVGGQVSLVQVPWFGLRRLGCINESCLISLVREAVSSSARKVDLYDLASGRSLVLEYLSDPSFIRRLLNELIRPPRVVDNITPLKDI